MSGHSAEPPSDDEDDAPPEPLVRPLQALALIEHWRSLDLPRMTDTSIEAALRTLITGLNSVVVTHRTLPGFRPLIRARLKRRKNSGNDKDWPWRRVQHLLHPTKDVRLGRCNTEGESALYCADKSVTACRELRVREGDEVVLISYLLRNATLGVLVGPANPSPHDTRIPLFEGEQLISYQLIRDFVRTEFTKPVGIDTNHLYRVSAAICREWFDESVDGWVYPSIESPANECTAIRARCVDRVIRIKDAALVRVFGVQDRCFAVEKLQQAIIHDDDTIDWRPQRDKTQWLCGCATPAHVIPLPPGHAPVFDWLKSRFRRLV